MGLVNWLIIMAAIGSVVGLLALAYIGERRDQMKELEHQDALQEVNMHTCTVCSETFTAGNPHRLMGAFGLSHTICNRCIECQDCEQQFDSFSSIVAATGGVYCTACAADLIGELQCEKEPLENRLETIQQSIDILVEKIDALEQRIGGGRYGR